MLGSDQGPDQSDLMRSRRVILVLLAIALGALVLRWSTAERRAEIGVTAEMAGRWVTTDERWAGRFLEIRPGEIVFGQGPEGEARFRIVGVFEVAPVGGLRTFAIRYREPDDLAAPETEVLIGLAHRELRFVSQPAVMWVPAR
ncbi:MAG: hypothetical protein H6Q03_2336 [Acidobacteria bacterium]|nr:hypothetical protein [Acidobacteriota bacterium]